MEPDELEMQVARAHLAEEQCRDRDVTIDALVAALDLTVDVLDGMRRAGCIHTDASEEDFYSYFVGPGVFENARAALALARNGGLK